MHGLFHDGREPNWNRYEPREPEPCEQVLWEPNRSEPREPEPREVVSWTEPREPEPDFGVEKIEM